MGLLDEPTTPKLDDLVGEGKRFKTTEELFAEFLRKDSGLTEALNKSKELETELRARENLAELSEKLMTQANRRIEEPMEPTRRELEPQGDKPVVDLRSEMKKLLDEEKSRDRRESNIARAKSQLQELYGPDYKAVLESVATSLGLPTSFLDDMAATSPDGFIQTVKAQKAPDKNTTTAPPANSLDTSRNVNTSVRKNWAYYKELMTKDRNLFLSPKVQVEMNREILEQGRDTFYS